MRTDTEFPPSLPAANSGWPQQGAEKPPRRGRQSRNWQKEKEVYYALQATSSRDAAALAAKSRRQFGEGYKRGIWAIVGPMGQRPWAWREALPAAGDWNMYRGGSPQDAADRAGIDF